MTRKSAAFFVAIAALLLAACAGRSATSLTAAVTRCPGCRIS